MNVTFRINGKTASLDVDPARRLLSLLNDEFRLPGSRASCGIGRCGACVVLLDGRPVNACLILAAKLEGAEVVTVEGLGTRGDMVRNALAEAGGVQCGYCASGLVMTLTYLAEQGLLADAASAEALLSGQICRCTGYGGLKRAIAMLQSGRGGARVPDL